MSTTYHDHVVLNSADAEKKVERLECAVCCEEIDPAQTLKLPCKHCYHVPCMNDWAQRHAGMDVTCPQCRAPVSQEILQELQRPLSYADILVLPIMLLVMVVETLHGHSTIACQYIKNGTVKLEAAMRSTFSVIFTMLQAFLESTRTWLVPAMLISFQTIRTLWHGIQQKVISVHARAWSWLCFGLQHVATWWLSFWHVMVSVCADAWSDFHIAMRHVVDFLWTVVNVLGPAVQAVMESLKMLSAWVFTRAVSATTAVLQAAGRLFQGIQHIMVVIRARAWNCLCTVRRHTWHFSRSVSCAFDRVVKMMSGPLQTMRTWLVKHTDAMLLVFLNMMLFCRALIWTAGLLLQRIHLMAISWCSRAKLGFLLVMQDVLTSWHGIQRRMASVCSHAWDSLCTAMQTVSDLLWSLLQALGRATKMVAEPMKTLTVAATHAAFGLAGRLLHSVLTFVTSVCFRASDGLHVVMWGMSHLLRTMQQLLGGVITLIAPWCRQLISAVLSTMQRICRIVRMAGACFLDRLSMTVKLVSLLCWTRLQELGCIVIAVVEPVKVFLILTFTPMMCATFGHAKSVLHNMYSLMASGGALAWYQICTVLLNLSYSVSKVLHTFGSAVKKVLAFTAQSVSWLVRSIRRGVSCLANTILLILTTVLITAYNIVCRPRCSVCKRGCAKLRSLCFTCVGDHLVPRCSDCGLGWCKVGTRCFSCLAEHRFLRCGVCKRGFQKIGTRCITCFADQFLHRCAACQRGYQKLGTSFCITCLADRLFCRCGVCRRGFCKIGTRCFSCLCAHLVNYCSQPPRCTLCSQGYQKVGTFCFSCYLDRFYQRCAVCQQGYAKVGKLCFTCYLDRFSCRCGVCHRGFAKIGSRCFTCFKVHITSFCHCGVCKKGYAKIGTRCFTCFKAHVTNFLRCGVCLRGHAKIGTRCFTCFKAYARDLLHNPPQCGICHRGSAKIGSRCFTCHRALLWSAPPSGHRAGGKRSPGTKTLLELAG